MRRCPAFIQDARRGENDNAGAKGHQPGPSRTRVLQFPDQLARYRLVDPTPTRHDHKIGVAQGFKSVIQPNLETAGGPERLWLDACYCKAVPARLHLRARQAEYLVGDAELEGAEPVIG
jgi:hypothetical protein